MSTTLYPSPICDSLVCLPQIFTAICDSFSHGANDVANAMGPFAGIYLVYTTGVVEKDGDLGNDAFWILAMGGVGIVVGLALYG